MKDYDVGDCFHDFAGLAKTKRKCYAQGMRIFNNQNSLKLPSWQKDPNPTGPSRIVLSEDSVTIKNGAFV